MHIESVVILLFTLAAAVALFARWLKVPYTVALVIAGLLAGSTGRLPTPHLSKELLFTIFLPGLVFEAAYHLEFRRFWANKLAINSLAIPGVVVSIALTAILLTPLIAGLHFVEGFGLIHGLVFAAVIVATDPIAVVGLFKTLGAPRRLGVLIEGESLLNDGTSVVLFSLVLSIATGRELSVGAAAVDFLRVVGLGAVVGIAVGFGISKVIQRVDEAMVEITLTTIAAYGSFVLAEQLDCSGVIATVAAGMICGNYAAETGMTPTTRVAVESFWEYLAFALNSFVFLLIGLEVRLDALVASVMPILVAFTVVVIGRACVLWIVGLLLGHTAEKTPRSWSAVLTWGGLRGSLSMVLALSLPADFAHRDILVTMTFGVVILSILVQGFTMAPLLRWLRLTRAGHDPTALEAAEGRLLAADAALANLDALAARGESPPETTERLQRRFEAARADAADERRRLLAASPMTDHDAGVLRQLLFAQKEALLRAQLRGAISERVFDELTKTVDDELAGIEHPRDPSSETEAPRVGTPRADE